MREYIRQLRERRRQEALTALGGRCARCGSTESLEFDHVDPESKSDRIAKMWTASEAKFQAELAKCQLLCHDHHVEKTRAENGWRRNHGGVSRVAKAAACKAATSDTT